MSPDNGPLLNPDVVAKLFQFNGISGFNFKDNNEKLLQLDNDLLLLVCQDLSGLFWFK